MATAATSMAMHIADHRMVAEEVFHCRQFPITGVAFAHLRIHGHGLRNLPPCTLTEYVPFTS